jgi:hypothetical protein
MRRIVRQTGHVGAQVQRGRWRAYFLTWLHSAALHEPAWPTCKKDKAYDAYPRAASALLYALRADHAADARHSVR